MANEVRLSVPSSEESLYLFRTVVASIAARLEFSLDDIDDVALAVSEAAAFLSGEAGELSRMSMRVAAEGSLVEATLWTERQLSPWPPENAQDGLAWKILSALTDRAEFLTQPDGPGIRLVKKSSSAERLP